MEHDIRQLRSWSDLQLSALALVLQRTVQAWQRDWGLPASEVACVAAGEEDTTHWQPLPGVARAWWRDALAGDAQLREALRAALFGAPTDAGDRAGAAGVAAEVAQSAWADFWNRIAALGHGADTGDPHQCFQPWSGAVVATLPWCGRSLRLLLAGAEAEALLPPAARALRAVPAPAEPLVRAIAPLPCTVRAELAPVELSLGAVHALRVGDVLELSHALDAPLLARTEGGSLLAEAYLGKAAGHRAIELARAAAATH